MIISPIHGRRWVPLVILGAAGVIHAGMWAGLVPCPAMSMGACLAAAVAFTAAGSLAAIACTRPRLRGARPERWPPLPRVPVPEPARAAAARAGAAG